MRTGFLPFALPDIGDAEIAAVSEVLASGWITTGPKAQQFEREFARYIGVEHAVALNSCTAALHLALEAAGVRAGDVVITTPYTFAATAEVIRYFDAVPVFVDVDPKTLNLDPAALAETLEDLAAAFEGRAPATVGVARALSRQGRDYAAGQPAPTARVRAIVPVHMAGHSCDMDRIAGLAARYELAVIEDCAHACSATWNGRRVGAPPSPNVPWAACFSFYATKTLATGEGGMLVTNRQDWADRCRVMSLHGISRDAWKRYTAEGAWYYEIEAPGFKYNMPDMAAALGVVQLARVDEMRRRRAEIARRYTETFATEAAFELPYVSSHAGHAWHLYMLRLNDELTIDRDHFIVELKHRNIGSSVHFIPLHVHPYYRERYGYEPDDFRRAHQQYLREISLPIYSRMTDEDVEHVISGVLDVAQTLKAGRYASAGR